VAQECLPVSDEARVVGVFAGSHARDLRQQARVAREREAEQPHQLRVEVGVDQTGLMAVSDLLDLGFDDGQALLLVRNRARCRKSGPFWSSRGSSRRVCTTS
jgi:hypothetical protein